MRNGTIYVRLEALRRLLWEKAEAWMGKRGDGALKSALDGYGFADAPGAAIDRMAAAEAETLILHELGEHAAGRALGPAWEAMLAALANRRAELFVRAARDHLADCLVTLPALLDARRRRVGAFLVRQPRRHAAAARFRRLTAAYAAWRGGDGGRALRAAARAGAAHWARVCNEILALHEARGPEAAAAIESLAAAAASPAPTQPPACVPIPSTDRRCAI